MGPGVAVGRPHLLVVPVDDLRRIVLPLAERDHQALGVGDLLGGPAEELPAVGRGMPLVVEVVLVVRAGAARWMVPGRGIRDGRPAPVPDSSGRAVPPWPMPTRPIADAPARRGAGRAPRSPWPRRGPASGRGSAGLPRRACRPGSRPRLRRSHPRCRRGPSPPCGILRLSSGSPGPSPRYWWHLPRGFSSLFFPTLAHRMIILDDSAR